MEFCGLRELQNQTGHQVYDWPLVVAKGLFDNALDACEEAEIIGAARHSSGARRPVVCCPGGAVIGGLGGGGQPFWRKRRRMKAKRGTGPIRRGRRKCAQREFSRLCEPQALRFGRLPLLACGQSAGSKLRTSSPLRF
jgi:hypothetical protein